MRSGRTTFTSARASTPHRAVAAWSPPAATCNECISRRASPPSTRSNLAGDEVGIWSRVGWKAQCKRASLARLRVHFDVAPERTGEVARQVQAEAGAVDPAGQRQVQPPKGLKEPAYLLLGDADALVNDIDCNPAWLLANHDRDVA